MGDMNNTTPSTFINADDFCSPVEVQDKNEKSRFNNHGAQCFLCHKGMSPNAQNNAWHVHLISNVTAQFVSVDMADVLDSNDMGWFPVGSECAKRVPLTHRKKVDYFNVWSS